jgi:1-phosphofructokinase family hexose kinase
VILAAGLTPAWQQVLVFDSFRFGEVNRAREAHWCASGKVFNAGIALHLLGGPSMTLAPVGGLNLVPIEREFKGKNIDHRWVVTRAATRVCTTIIDCGSGTLGGVSRPAPIITELVENGQPLTAEELGEFRRAYVEEAAKAEIAILIGSLPVGTPDSYYRDLLALTPCPAILDFRGPGLLSCLDLRPLVVKPNREELAQTVGRPLDTDEDLLDAMRSLNGRGAQWVVITQGSRPIWVTCANAAYRLHPLPVETVINPIGCGDVMTAAMAWSLRSGRDILDALRLGLAAAHANLQDVLPGRFDATGIHELAEAVRVEDIRKR